MSFIIHFVSNRYSHNSFRQETVDYLSCLLNQRTPFQCVSLHGKQDQADRIWSIQEFKKQRKTVMISTSLASRGLHVDDLNLVINYTAPNHLEDYIHRVGRTGRAGKAGVAYTFVTPEDEDKAYDIVKALRNSHVEVPQQLQELAEVHRQKKLEQKKLERQQVTPQFKGFHNGCHGFSFQNQEKKSDIIEDLFTEKNVNMKEEEEGEGEQPEKQVQTSTVEKVKQFLNKHQHTFSISAMDNNNDDDLVVREIDINDYPQVLYFRFRFACSEQIH